MKTEIIKEVANDASITSIARKIAKGNDIYKDLLQYLYEILLQMPDEKIKDAKEKNYLKYLCVRIMNLSMNQPRHPFAIEHQQLCNTCEVAEYTMPVLVDVEISELFSEDDLQADKDNKRDAVVQYISQEITQDNFFDITIFQMWYSGYSYRQIAAKIGVNHMVIHNSVSRSRQAIAKIYG